MSRRLLSELRSRPGAERTLELLKHLSAQALRGKSLTAYHDALLFSKVYPVSRAVWKFCCAELSRFEHRVSRLKESERLRFDQTGIAGSRLSYRFGYPEAQWMAGHCKDLEIDWDEYETSDDDPLATWLPLLAEEIEADALDDASISSREFLTAASGGKSSARWLIDRMEATLADCVRRTVWDELDLVLVASLGAGSPSRTTIDNGVPRRPVLAFREREKLDWQKEIRRPLRLPRPVSKERGRRLLDIMRGTLFTRLRELYPVNFANPAEVYDIPLGRGARLVGWLMEPGMRLPIETDWTCMVLKNSVPIAYGGGGIMPQRAEVALNVLEPYRGGETQWLYAQFVRVARALCPSPWIVVRKWQIGGEENKEGINSGSYWFYDKLGFRSIDRELCRIADRERDKIRKSPGYRTARAVLKRLSKSDMALSLEGEPSTKYREYPLGKVGLLATMTAAKLCPDRRKLQAVVLRELKRRFGADASRWTNWEKVRGSGLALLAFALPGFDRLPARRQRDFFEACRLKGGKYEADFARAIVNSADVLNRLAEIAGNRPSK